MDRDIKIDRVIKIQNWLMDMAWMDIPRSQLYPIMMNLFILRSKKQAIRIINCYKAFSDGDINQGEFRSKLLSLLGASK
jgi:hypothetical protein